MLGITLRQLRYFDALARHGHFGRAAEACAISQPALSMQIKELEGMLGAPLFERSARQVRLTSMGAELAPRARAILQSVDELEDLARASSDGLSGPLRLGVIPTVAPYLLPGLVGALMRDHPALDVRVRETLTPKLIRELADGRLDAAIVALPVGEESFAERPLFSEDFVLVRPAADADKPVPNADGLRRMRLLLLEEGHCFRDQALEFCAMSSGPPRELMDASSLSTLVQLVGAGIGVTLIPQMAAPVETRAANVAVARFAAPRPSRTIGMIWRRASPMAGRYEELAGSVEAACDRLRSLWEAAAASDR